MTEQEERNLSIAWGVLVQWLAHRGELVEWMDDVMLAENDDWNQGFDPHDTHVMTCYDFFDWTPTCGKGGRNGRRSGVLLPRDCKKNSIKNFHRDIKKLGVLYDKEG